MDSFETTRLIMRDYALKLAKDINSKDLSILDSANYIDMLLEIHSRLMEYNTNTLSEDFKQSIKTNKDTRIILLKQLLVISLTGIITGDKDFININRKLIENIILY